SCRVMKTFANSVKFALKGMRAAWSGRNFRIQVAVACVAVVGGAAFAITKTEWLVVLLLVGLVLSAEIMNSAIEQLVDMISPEYHPVAGRVKDLAAGAVLLLAIMSAIVGLVIFLPYIRTLV